MKLKETEKRRVEVDVHSGGRTAVVERHRTAVVQRHRTAVVRGGGAKAHTVARKVLLKIGNIVIVKKRRRQVCIALCLMPCPHNLASVVRSLETIEN